MHTRYFDLRDTKGQQKIIEDQISAAADILRQGGLVAIPTETVYGLGANALDEEAVHKIFEAKGRPQDNPLIIHVPGPQWLPRYCQDVPPLAYTLARKFWPGPLTMILKRKKVVPDATTAGLDTVGVRCPDHQVTLAIIREAGVPIAAPSANTSGRPSCTCAADCMEDMEGKIDAVVDGGPCQVGVESTIVDLTCDPPRLLRPGGLPLEALEEIAGPLTVDKAVTEPLKDGEKPKAPGMKYRHYAPKAPVTVVTGPAEASARTIQEMVQPGDGVICFDEFAEAFPQQQVECLGPSKDKRIQAQRVFDALRAFDSKDVQQIYAQCPDSQGLGLAVSNRLKKAAGFKTIAAGQKKVVLGITGGTGSGKTSALEAIRDLGGVVIDCDAVYHEMLDKDADLRHAIEVKFHGVFNSDGTLNRKKLGELVFENKERMAQLNEVIYQFLVPEIQKRAREGYLTAIDAINLIESGVGELCDRTIAITAPAELRVRRIMARDGIDERYARMRISAQKSDEFYRSKCDYELSNTAETPEAFRETARVFFGRLIGELREEKNEAAQ